MSAGYSAVALFCEDIREEKSGTTTLVGVFSDNIEVPQLPMNFPKLAVYTRIIFPINQKPEELQVIIKDADGKETNFSSFDRDFVKKTIDGVKSKGAPIVGLITRAIAPGFPVQKAGRLLILVRGAKFEIIAGQLNIRVSEQSSTEPSASAQPS